MIEKYFIFISLYWLKIGLAGSLKNEKICKKLDEKRGCLWLMIYMMYVILNILQYWKAPLLFFNHLEDNGLAIFSTEFPYEDIPKNC